MKGASVTQAGLAVLRQLVTSTSNGAHRLVPHDAGIPPDHFGDLGDRIKHHRDRFKVPPDGRHQNDEIFACRDIHGSGMKPKRLAGKPFGLTFASTDVKGLGRGELASLERRPFMLC
ncbi:hypothetical protein CISG_07694 [Coccidioides immitis RMSCC 3703]|uniref:Uncharacterized protein n=2 Tax=Coccidioides immitis TaxID=5501 RepID=A0A0J8R6B0_COCIT|nr:hypothetical protein CIRG_02883 [Coccidioides immitis RMSCC 2394]KMU79263.1 hypothetical protein CISG_07694 [Coccidioides immitis RMSCC 3703]